MAPVNVLLMAALAAVAGTSSRAPAPTAVSCVASTVHYTDTKIIGPPWIRAGGITGHLFAYGGKTLMDARVNASDGVVLYVRGGTGDPATKVLWTTKGGSGWLGVHGTRLDGSGSFRQRFESAGAGQFRQS